MSARTNKGKRLPRSAWDIAPGMKLGGPQNSLVLQVTPERPFAFLDRNLSGWCILKSKFDRTFGVGTRWIEIMATPTTMYSADWRAAIAAMDLVQGLLLSSPSDWKQVYHGIPLHVFSIYDLYSKGDRAAKWYKRRTKLADRPCFCYRLDCPDIGRRTRWVEERNQGVVPPGEVWRQAMLDGQQSSEQVPDAPAAPLPHVS